MSSTSSSFTTNLYNGAADVGHVYAILRLVIVSLVVCLMIGFSIYLFIHPTTTTSSALATVQQGTTCVATTTSSSSPSTQTCSLILSYIPQGGSSTTVTLNNLDQSSNTYIIGQTLTIYYDPKNVQNVSLYNVTNYDIAIVLLIVGVVMEFLVGLDFYLVHSSQSYAALTGGVSAIGSVKNLFG